jgi:Tfp pilus assembly protein PilO
MVTPEKIREVINKLPILGLLAVYLGYLGIDYYQFDTDAESPLGQRRAAFQSKTTAVAALKVKLKELENFARTLETKKLDLKNKVDEFNRVGGSIPEKFDAPLFMKTLITEAKRQGLKVEGLKPKGSTEKEFYLESVFSFGYRGFYSQLLGFVYRLANTTAINRVDELSLVPAPQAGARFIEISGEFDIKTYTYLAGKAASMVKQMAAASEAAYMAATGGKSLSGGGLAGHPVSTVPGDAAGVKKAPSAAPGAGGSP